MKKSAARRQAGRYCSCPSERITFIGYTSSTHYDALRRSFRMPRTRDGETVAAFVAQKPLLAESVYLSPQFNDRSIEKEVTDLLLVHREKTLAIQIKCQEDPDARSGDRLLRWVNRKAMSGYRQLCGTLQTLRERDYWCIHPTFGRTDFVSGQLQPIHGVVVVEHRARNLILSETLPLERHNVPLTYISFSDFCQLVTELRTFPDLCDYLQARSSA